MQFQWEVMNPSTAEVKIRVPFRWMARFITRYRLVGNEYWDYAKRGEGY